MAVNLINSNEIEISQTDNNIQLGFSSGGQVATNTSDIADLQDNQGDLSELETTIKTNLVSSINEVFNKSRYIVLEKTTQASLTQNYVDVTWQNVTGDTDDIVLASNGYDITINCDCKFALMLLSMNTTSNTMLYWRNLKNGSEYYNQWDSTTSFHNLTCIMPVQKNDVIKSQFYASTNTNTSAGNMNKLIIILFN